MNNITSPYELKLGDLLTWKSALHLGTKSGYVVYMIIEASDDHVKLFPRHDGSAYFYLRTNLDWLFRTDWTGAVSNFEVTR